ncbi:MAG TPA: cytochrome c [Terriglobales bacterium]
MTVPHKFAVLLALSAGLLAFASTDTLSAPSVATTASDQAIHERWMAEGEKRYRTNCGRCHQPPHKFPPRTMSMAVRHMRVRGMLTEDDMKYVLYYMTH